MNRNLHTPQAGETPSASWARDLVSLVRSLRLQVMYPLCLSRTPEGTTLRLVSSSGVRAPLAFPYGSRWVFGLEIITAAAAITVRVHNPLLHRAGLTMTDWWAEASYFFGPIPDKVYLETPVVEADWAVSGKEARVLIAYRLDTVTATGSLLVCKDVAEASTLPTSDGAGTVDPLRYYLVPLYILTAAYTAAVEAAEGPPAVEAVPAKFADPDIYIDCIHGVFTPALM